MAKMRPFAPLQPLPAHFLNAGQEFISTAAPNFRVRIKPGDATVLQVPADAVNGQVGIGIEGKWRYIASSVERASPGGAARTLDVFVTGTANVFVPGDVSETDETVYTFELTIVEAGVTPVGVAHSRRVATAEWSGTAFTAVDNLVGPASGTARHMSTHATGGSDAIAPADIGAATASGLAAQAAALTAHGAASDPHPQYALDTELTAEASARSAADALKADASALTAHMSQGSGLAHSIPVVTSLPSSPSDRQTVDLLIDDTGDLGGPFLLRLKYRSASPGPYRWHPVGDLTLFSSVDSDPFADATFTSTTFVAPAGGPTITLPLAGVWIVTVGGNWAADANLAAPYFSYTIGGAAANEADGTAGYSSNSGAGVRRDDRRSRRKTIATAATLTFQWKVTAGTVRGYNRFLEARPLRLG